MAIRKNIYYCSEGCVYGPPPPWLDKYEPTPKPKRKWLKITIYAVITCALAALIAVALA